MQRLFFLMLPAIVLLSACSSKKPTTSLPVAPVSGKAVQDAIKGNKYKAEKAGTHSAFKDDPAIGWIGDGKENENEFEKKIATEAVTLQLNFINDTAVSVYLNNKTFNGTYTVDDIHAEDEKAGIRLRISYIDEEFVVGDSAPTKAIYTYLVEGIDQKSLLLETPRSINDRKIVVLMNRQ